MMHNTSATISSRIEKLFLSMLLLLIYLGLGSSASSIKGVYNKKRGDGLEEINETEMMKPAVERRKLNKVKAGLDNTSTNPNEVRGGTATQYYRDGSTGKRGTGKSQDSNGCSCRDGSIRYYLKVFGERKDWWFAVAEASNLFPSNIAKCQLTPIADQDEFDEVQSAYEEYVNDGDDNDRPRPNTWVGAYADVRRTVEAGSQVANVDDWRNLDGTDLFEGAWGTSPQPNNNVPAGGPQTAAFIVADEGRTEDVNRLDDVNPYRTQATAGMYKCCFSECPSLSSTFD